MIVEEEEVVVARTEDFMSTMSRSFIREGRSFVSIFSTSSSSSSLVTGVVAASLDESFVGEVGGWDLRDSKVRHCFLLVLRNISSTP